MRYEEIDDTENEAGKIADGLIEEVGDTTILELVAEKLQTALRRLSILRVLQEQEEKD